jgi:hypothetical protein
VLTKVRAYSALAEIALQTSNFRRAASHYLAGAEYMDVSLRRVGSGLEQAQLNHWRNVFFNSYVLTLDRDPQSDEERLEIWQACLGIFRRGTIAGTSVIFVGAKNLAVWWGAVERRNRHDSKAGQIMQQQLKALHNMIGDAVSKEWRGSEEELRNVQTLVTDLQRRCNEYGVARKTTS